MVTILLTGIPGVGKTGLVETTQALSSEFYERTVQSISLGSLVAREAHGFWGSPPEGIARVDDTLQSALRGYAISETALQLSELGSSSRHVLIDTPLSLLIRGGFVPVNTFDAVHIAKLHKARGIDYVVTVIDDPNAVAERLRDSPYPTNSDELLKWMAQEVSIAKSVLPSLDGSLDTSERVRHLIIPRDHSEETLTKLLNDEQPPVCYFAFPISYLHEKDTDPAKIKEQKQKAKQVISEFIDQLQEYCVVKVPIKIADLNATTPTETEATVHRDKSWFVRNADFTLAFFPPNYKEVFSDDKKIKGEELSTGVSEEVRESIRLGKPTIIIHPNVKQERDVFGIKTPLQYRSADEFFEAVTQSKNNDNPNDNILGRLLDLENSLPRYAHLRDFSVAADFFRIEEMGGRQEYSHLLGLRASGRQKEGYWTLVTGKREIDEKTGRKETGTRAIWREVVQEAGIVFFDPTAGSYRLYKTDFGPTPYFRVYPVLYHPKMGSPTENYISDETGKKEMDDLRWFTVDKILKLEKLLPGTRRYFEDIAAGKVSVFSHSPTPP